MAPFSRFGSRFTRPTGARDLMEDLGEAMARETPAMMLGGGNPAHIPEILDLLSDRLHDIADRPRELRRMLADYAAPAGELRFREALAAMLERCYGWPLTADNIALTSGSQAGFFQLFNLLAGESDGGAPKRILLPMTPEYAGYNDLGLNDDLFAAVRPLIEHLDDRLFKYHVNFDELTVDDRIAAICVSRPTNPTGNVLTDAEMRSLGRIARDAGVPLIVDNAYGMPFPQIVFTDARPYWDENVILCMSLSKIGLPAVRTGIVIAAEEIIDALASMNAVLSLAVGSVGPVLLHELVESDDLIRISREIIRPFYEARLADALQWCRNAFEGIDYHIHRPEGAFFLWLWFPELSIDSEELYQRLKARGVYVLPGHHFFPGLREDWLHTRQCLRISYCQEPHSVRAGLAIIREELDRAAA